MRLALFAGVSLQTACVHGTSFVGETVVDVAKLEPAEPAPPPPVLEPPPTTASHVQVQADRIVIDQKIQFDEAKATIRPESASLLDEIASVLKAHPDIKKVRIEGHASSEGRAALNKKLSEARAKAVLESLVQRGVGASSLVSKGFGSSQPIAPNDTDEGRQKNRRVDFVIVEPGAAPNGGKKP